MNALSFATQALSPLFRTIADPPSLEDQAMEIIGIFAPLLVVVIVGVLVYYIYVGSHDRTISGTARGECKRDIIRAMRQQISGLTVMEVAKVADLTKEQAIDILQEMKSENQVYTTSFRGQEVWCVKGIGEGNLYK